jgi:hypothetical protein
VIFVVSGCFDYYEGGDPLAAFRTEDGAKAFVEADKARRGKRDYRRRPESWPFDYYEITPVELDD